MDQHIKDWCYAECERQHATTPEDIDGMHNAWEYARLVTTIDLFVIRELAIRIDPGANPGGRFRTGPAVFMNGGTAAPASEIERKLEELLASHYDKPWPAWFFYRELMYIHPFKDGNGRVGALVYNILNGTIDNPVVPPEYR